MRDHLVNRRDFLKTSNLAVAGAALTPGISGTLANMTQSVDSMRITRVESITFQKDLKIGGGSGGADGAEFWWVRLHTDNGLVGLGETYPFEGSEVGALADVADEIVGSDPRDIAALWKSLHHRLTMRNAGGAEMRVLSALNMAQMDILSQSAALPLYRLLGGRVRDQVKVYNTTTAYWAINEMKMGSDTGQIVDFLL
jgi:L-alanine-DL-glutamate epimerase-like enolase superfamily enzyme